MVRPLGLGLGQSERDPPGGGSSRGGRPPLPARAPGMEPKAAAAPPAPAALELELPTTPFASARGVEVGAGDRPPPPPDRWNLAWCCWFLLGVGILFP